MSERTRPEFLEWARAPGKHWRILAHREGTPVEMSDEGDFDEIVIDHWLHLERMGEKEWLLALGHAPEIAVWIEIQEDASVKLRIKIHGPTTVEVPQER